MAKVKIRYNTTCTDNKNYWRILIDDVEYIAQDIEILCPCYTTEDYIEGVGNKFHISCNPVYIQKLENNDSIKYILK